MESPISVKEMTKKTLQRLLDVIVDSRGNVKSDEIGNLQLANVSAQDLITLGVARENIEKIISSILDEEVYFGLNFRNKHGSRFNIRRKMIKKL